MHYGVLQKFMINYISSFLILLMSVSTHSNAEDTTQVVNIAKGNRLIKLGDNSSEVIKHLTALSCRDISSSVGIKYNAKIKGDTSSHKVLWYILNDETCVCLIFELPRMGKQYKLASIKKGEAGAGYGGKIVWRNQKITSEKVLELKPKLLK